MKKRSVFLGIAGGSGAGKGWVTQKLQQYLQPYRCVVVQLDDYYLPLPHLSVDERANRNYDHPDAIDFALLTSQITSLIHGKHIQQPQYDFSVHDRSSETRELFPGDVTVLEGLLALHDSNLCKLMDLSIYTATSEKVRFQRRLKRDTKERGRTEESVHEQYNQFVLPMHRKYVEPCKKRADIIISGERDNLHDIVRLANHVRKLLKRQNGKKV